MPEKFKILSVGGKGKGLNIFKSSAYKEHERAPRAQEFWRIRWAVGVWLGCALAVMFAFVGEHIWRYGWSPATWAWIKIFLTNALQTGGLSVVAEIPFWASRAIMRADIMCIVPLLPVVAYFFMTDGTVTKEFNPHGKDAFDEKSSKKASADDIKKMAANHKNKEGLFAGFMMVLGYFKNKGKSVPLKMDECLSTLLLAPAGTGKTVGVVIPTILECDDVSMIINDPKPELNVLTSRYRASIGPTFILDWGAADEPERGIYHPAWNPLSPENMPVDEEGRNTYIQTIVNALIQEAQGSADPHWSQSARAALTGFLNFIISKAERAKANDYFYNRLNEGTFDADDAAVLADYYATMTSDQNAFAAMSMLSRGELNASNYVHVGTWAGLPEEWHGSEASIPMMLAWYTQSQLIVGEEMEERKRQGDQMAMLGSDPMKDLLMRAVNEAQLYAYAPDAVSSMLNLANTPDRERGSIFSTMNAGINIFRHPGVNKHTRHSDFHFSDVRGMIDPRDGKMKPVTIYLSINVADASAFSPITSMFIELLSKYLIAHKPDDVYNGQKMGPCPALFVLDEMPTMNKLEAIIQGPAVGRGQKVSYLIVGQDISQIAEKYGDKAADTVIANTAAKIILRINDPATAQRFVSMMGNQIKIKKVKDGDKEKDEKSSSPLFTEMDLMTMSVEKQIVLFQGYYNRPIEAEQARWYKNKTPAEQGLYNKVMMGASSPVAAPSVPDYLIPKHHAMLRYPGVPRIYDPVTGQTREIH